jgi:hypothetical protein
MRYICHNCGHTEHYFGNEKSFPCSDCCIANVVPEEGSIILDNNTKEQMAAILLFTGTEEQKQKSLRQFAWSLKAELHVNRFLQQDNTGADKQQLDYAKFVLRYLAINKKDRDDFNPWMSQFELYCTYKDIRHKVVCVTSLGELGLTPNFDVPLAEELVSYTECSNWSSISSYF